MSQEFMYHSARGADAAATRERILARRNEVAERLELLRHEKSARTFAGAPSLLLQSSARAGDTWGSSYGTPSSAAFAPASSLQAGLARGGGGGSGGGGAPGASPSVRAHPLAASPYGHYSSLLQGGGAAGSGAPSTAQFLRGGGLQQQQQQRQWGSPRPGDALGPELHGGSSLLPAPAGAAPRAGDLRAHFFAPPQQPREEQPLPWQPAAAPPAQHEPWPLPAAPQAAA